MREQIKNALEGDFEVNVPTMAAERRPFLGVVDNRGSNNWPPGPLTLKESETVETEECTSLTRLKPNIEI